jgi:regulator of RNase E activity RraA
VADDDGIVVIDPADIEPVLSAARQRSEREAEMFTALEAGRTTLELLGLGDLDA